MYNFYPKNWGYVRSRHIAHKFLLIMKLTILILVTAMLHVSASSLAQKVTLEKRNAPLTVIFDEISNQTGYNFLFTGSDLKNAKPISITVKNADLNEVLNQIFLDQPLSYTIENKSVVVSVKDPSFFDQLTDKVKTVLSIPTKIGGIVTDTLGRPLADASVSIKGTKFTTHTDSKGYFSFPDMPQGKYTLEVSYVGYEKFETTVTNTGKYEQLAVVLRLRVSALDQVRVIAYGTDSRRFSVGSVATVTADDIEKQPVTNPLLALQGQVAGLNITATSGVPGSQVLVQVRGQNTINSTTNTNFKPYDQPLFIIDGVPFASQNNSVNQIAALAAQNYSTGGTSQVAGLSPFNNINPADIESITILKDADATSIYGSQGANGVVLITTKKGKPGATAFDLNVNTSYNSVGRPVPLMNTPQYLQLRKDAFAADGVTPNNTLYDPGYAPDLTVFDQNKYTNWQKIIYGQNTNNTDVHGSLSGGSATNTFLISTGYNRSTYNYPGNFADQRYTLHTNLHHNSTDNRFLVDLTTDYGYDQNNTAGYGGGQLVTLSPNLPDLLGPTGNFIWNYQGVDLTGDQFYSLLKQPTDVQNYNFNTALRISYKLLKGLTIGATLGYNRNTTNETSQIPGAAQNPLATITRISMFGDNNFQTVNIEPQINYSKTIGRGILSVLVGGTYKKNTNDKTMTTGQGYSSDGFLGSINGAPIVYANDAYNIYKYSAGFARLNYIYDSEFILNLTGRRDGSSSFGPGLQFGNFGSVGAGWIFTEEKFLKESLPLLSYGKLSGSYGTTGSDIDKSYQYQALYASSPSYVSTFQGISPNTPLNLYNPYYSWALKKSLNLSLDLGFFESRLLLNATYYRERENNQLVNYPLPIQTGFPSVLGNLDATVQNQGFEFSINSTNVKTKNFSWTTSFNLSFNRNKLISFPDLENSTYANVYQIGQPTSIIYGFRYKDVNPQTGLFEFYAKDGSVTSTPNYGSASAGGDQVPIANEVKYMGGFGNNFSYKQFSLYIFCQFSSQVAPNYLAEIYPGNLLGFMSNQPTAVAGNYWKAPGDNAQLQRLASSYNSSSIRPALAFGQSTGVYTNDTYLRVKTISLSYQLPNSLLSKIHVKGATIFANGQNLLTFTNYKVGDPEQPGSYTNFPIQRILAFGLNLKF